MTFTRRLEAAAAMTQERLADLLEGQGQAVPVRLMAAMRHGLLGGGKRLRPFLVLETAHLFGLTPDKAIETAVALECIHCYSLVHDDLPAMDNDEMRRGRPTVWKAFDDWTAILAGDALLTLAFEIQAAPAVHATPSVRLELVAALARAAGASGMVGGQMMDLEADKLGQPPQPDIAHIRRLQAMKTGALITYACEAGAILGRAGQRERAALGRYGQHLGLAFQFADDLLDTEGDPAKLGKATAKDAVAGKATLVSLMGVKDARAELAAAEAGAIAALENFGPRADMLREAARFVARRDH